jgi:hypothetical protein
VEPEINKRKSNDIEIITKEIIAKDFLELKMK